MKRWTAIELVERSGNPEHRNAVRDYIEKQHAAIDKLRAELQRMCDILLMKESPSTMILKDTEPEP